MIKNDSPPQQNLSVVIKVLEDLMARRIILGYAVGGAVAAILHYEPISTIDLDIFFLLSEKPGALVSMAKIYDYAREKEFSFDHEFINIYGWLVQFVEASHNALWLSAIENCDVLEIDGCQVNVIDAEHLAAMWIFAGRKKDIRKIEMFDEGGVMNAHRLLEILKKFDLLEVWREKQHNFFDDYQF